MVEKVRVLLPHFYFGFPCGIGSLMMLPEYFNKGDNSVAQYPVFLVYYPVGLVDVGEVLL